MPAVAGRHTSDRSSSWSPDTATKSSWPPMPGVLPAAEAVGDDLPVEVDGDRAVDRDDVVVGRDHVRRVHDVDRQEADVVVAVEPPVQLRRAEREGAHGEPVVLALAQVRDLARPVELHETGREHLRVDAVVAAVALARATRRSSTGSRRCPSASVQPSWTKVAACAAIACSTADAGGSIERERRPVALDDHVDRVHVHAVRVLGRESERAREVRVRLDDEQPVRILGRALHLAHRRARVQRQAHPAVGIGRCRAGCDDARRELFGDVTNRRKSAGTNSMRAPLSTSTRSAGPKKPLT